jgi:ethanolamine ammonia-lyase small subunit
MNEDKLREIVQAVVTQMAAENGQQQMPLPTVASAVAKPILVNDSDIEDITTEEYMKKILVPNPKDPKAYRAFKDSTPARIGVWRAGDRPLTETIIRFRADHALAIDSVFSAVDEKFVDDLNLLKLKTKVCDKDQHLTRPDYGRELDSDSMKLLLEKCDKNPQLQVIVSDGLSSKAIEANMKDILPAFLQGLSANGIKVGTPVFVKYGRVGVMDEIGEALGAEAAIMFIGERPGLVTAESMSAYMIYNPRKSAAEAERTVVSNIHRGGTPPIEAGAHIATLIKRIIDAKASGVNIEK